MITFTAARVEVSLTAVFSISIILLGISLGQFIKVILREVRLAVS
jgi:hypothetical protein